MADPATTAPKKDKLLRIGVHEINNALAPLSGYLRMLLGGRTGALTDMQRQMLEQMGNSMAKLSGLVKEMDSLSLLEAGGATFNRSLVDFGALIRGEVNSLPPMIDREEVQVTFQDEAPGAKVHGDPARLSATMRSLLIAHRRELVTSAELRLCVERATQNGSRTLRVTIGGADFIDELRRVPVEELTTYEEFRSNVGYSLSIARRVVAAHEGQLWSPPLDPRAGAVLFIPEA